MSGFPLRFMSTRTKSVFTCALPRNGLPKTKGKWKMSYVQKLSQHILDTEADTNIEVEIDIVPLHLSIESMMQFGIILNELMTNSIKYAFSNKKGKIKISLIKYEHRYKLLYEDNGIGIDKQTKGLGSNLIEMSVQQLGAKLDISNDNGVKYEIYFKENL